MIKCSQEQKQTAVETILIDGVPGYKVAAQYGVSKATVFNRKRQLLGKDGITSMPPKPDTAQSNESRSELESEIASLKSQIKHLQMERDELEKAAEILKSRRHQS